MNRVRQQSNATKLNVVGLVVTAAGGLLQLAAGSTLYPSVAGPTVLLVAGVVVALWSSRWTAWVGLIVPLVLGLGAIVAAVMTGDFIDQLTDVGNAGVVLGSWMHVVGLVAAIAGGVGMLLGQRSVAENER